MKVSGGNDRMKTLSKADKVSVKAAQDRLRMTIDNLRYASQFLREAGLSDEKVKTALAAALDAQEELR